MPTLTLLDEVRWQGDPVAGERSQALLAALVLDGGGPVRAERLSELVWGDAAADGSAKRLQVLISRVRSAHGAGAILSAAGGYRLGAAANEVDALALAALTAEAREALPADPERAAQRATEALRFGAGPRADTETGPLGEIQERAAADRGAARAILAQAQSRTGAHAEALPVLEQLAAATPYEEALLADLLRSEAVVRGPAAALERYDRYRRELRDALGTNPGEALRRVHRELLALDAPVRSGVRYDTTALLGRGEDIERLRGLLAGARVVSIVGAGGLGKTRLAHVLARDPATPVARVVELVGVAAPEDVVGEVGSALGVRDSLTSRRTLTPAERADLRGRIAQHLAQGPSLLVLDNCEHLIGAVAGLVAFLVASAPELRVLTTSRAPLAIAAERVYQLGALPEPDATELFRERAVAARPGVALPEDVVRTIVTRLDGLPLAIELAAARVRAMSVQEINNRLGDRFALLRGGDRSAPDRHQTLLAVIDWSWNLLDGAQQRALRQLAVWPDGLTLDAAESALGAGALDLLQGLADQSLLTVVETPRGLRYRMLETVREFGHAQLALSGERGEAQAARRAWAVRFAHTQTWRMFGPDQVDAVRATGAEEVTLADELRAALSDRDHAAVVELLAALGWLWSIRGEHGRLLALMGGVAEAFSGWTPAPEQVVMARMALLVTYTNLVFLGGGAAQQIRDLLAGMPVTAAEPPVLEASVRVMLAFDPRNPGASEEQLVELTRSPAPHVEALAWQWISHVRENAGDPEGALAAAERALSLLGDDEGPWRAGNLRSEIVQLRLQAGDRAGVAADARAAICVMQEIGAVDDEIQLHLLLALAAIGEGRLDEGQAALDRAVELDRTDAEFASRVLLDGVGAELLLARGETAAGLARYRACAAQMRAFRLPGVAPDVPGMWTLFGDASALAAHALHARDGSEEVAAGWDLYERTAAQTDAMLAVGARVIDVPMMGAALLSIGLWLLVRGDTPAAELAQLLVLAERLACNQTMPSMHWDPVAARLEREAPGALDAARSVYADVQAPELFSETRAALAPLLRERQ